PERELEPEYGRLDRAVGDVAQRELEERRLPIHAVDVDAQRRAGLGVDGHARRAQEAAVVRGLDVHGVGRPAPGRAGPGLPVGGGGFGGDRSMLQSQFAPTNAAAAVSPTAVSVVADARRTQAEMVLMALRWEDIRARKRRPRAKGLPNLHRSAVRALTRIGEISQDATDPPLANPAPDRRRPAARGGLRVGARPH